MNSVLKSKVIKLKKTTKFDRAITSAIMGTEYKPHDDFNALAQIEPVFIGDLVSISATLEKYRDTDHYLRMLLFYLLPVHQLLAIDQKTDPTKILLGPFVPKLMLAMKKAHNIGYNAWDRDDKLMRVALGKSLEHLLQLNQDVEWNITIRNAFVKEIGGKQAHVLKYASTNEYVGKFKELWGISTTPMSGTGVKSAVPYIILQLWNASCEQRVPSNMILDPYDWENIPDCFDYGSLPLEPIKPPNNFLDDLI